MKKMLKRMLSFVLAIGIVCGTLVVPSYAASTNQAKLPTLSKSKYIQCYTLKSSGKVYGYTDSSLKTKKGYVSCSADECYIISIKGSAVQVSFPTSSGRVVRWFKRSDFTATDISKSLNIKSATEKITTYRRSDGKQSYGYVGKNDDIYVLGTSGSYTQVIYELSSGKWKMGWIKTSAANSYLKPYSTIANGTYTISTALKSNMMLDVYHDRTANGTNVQIYQSNGGNNQKFKVTSVGSGWYKITNAVSGKALDVSGGKKASGVNVQMYTYNGTDAQKWMFYNAGNGYYYIKNKLGYYLDVSGGKTANETNVQVYSKNGTNSQKWKLSKTQVVATKATLNSTSFTLSGSGTTKTLTATITPSNASVSWKSSNTAVASVSYSGKSCTVKAVGNGTATISVISGGKTLAKATVTVKNCSVEAEVKARLDKIANGTLKYNSSTVLEVGKTFKGTRANEQCKGYAKNVFYLCFGVTPGSTQAQPNNHLLSTTSGMKKVGSVTNMTASNIIALFGKARPGDFVQMRRSQGGSHSAIVYSVTSTGVTFLEANVDGKNTIRKRTLTWSSLCSSNAKMSVYTATNYKLK